MLPVLIFIMPSVILISSLSYSFVMDRESLLANCIFLVSWVLIIAGFWVYKDVPILSKVIIGMSCFIVPILMIWRLQGFNWIRQVRKMRWAASGVWISLWYLLLDRTGLSLITCYIVWPTVGQLFWNAYDDQERDIRNVFRYLFKVIGDRSKTT